MEVNRKIKYETLITILSIVIYVIVNSYCMNNFGMNSYKTVICNLVLLVTILIYVIKNKLCEYYGLVKITKYKEFLFYIPLFIIMSINLWNGINISNTKEEIIAHIFTMICVGFLEEIIFRGFLFKMMENDNVKKAIIVTSLTFGLGHIVNLLNGADLVPTLIQICCAITIGFLFVTIFQKGKSLIPCIIAHIVINSTSIFGIENKISVYIVPIILVIVSISYSLYIRKNVK